MTPQILDWLRSHVGPLLSGIERVVEIGAYNVNGSARDALQARTHSWIGLDREPGPCVDVVCQASVWLKDKECLFDLVISCEAYEHDPRFWETHEAASKSVSEGGLYVVTTPTLGFPYHSYGGDFYRFTEDTYRQVFFNNFELIALGHFRDCAGSPGIAAVGRKPSST
jgi:hypothetical protein